MKDKIAQLRHNLNLSLVAFSKPLGCSPTQIKRMEIGTVIHGKGDKERSVSITDATVAHLKKYLRQFHPEMLPEQPLFYTKIKGSIAPMSPGNVSRIINKYADAIRSEHPNLPKHLHCHMFRRTRATGLYRNGVELEMISVILGHSSTETTRIYATPSIEMLGEAIEYSVASEPFNPLQRAIHSER